MHVYFMNECITHDIMYDIRQLGLAVHTLLAVVVVVVAACQQQQQQQIISHTIRRRQAADATQKKNGTWREVSCWHILFFCRGNKKKKGINITTNNNQLISGDWSISESFFATTTNYNSSTTHNDK